MTRATLRLAILLVVLGGTAAIHPVITATGYDNCTTCANSEVTCEFACRFFGGVADFQCDPASPCDYTCACVDGGPP